MYSTLEKKEEMQKLDVAIPVTMITKQRPQLLGVERNLCPSSKNPLLVRGSYASKLTLVLKENDFSYSCWHYYCKHFHRWNCVLVSRLLLSLYFFHPVFSFLFSFHTLCHLLVNCTYLPFSPGSLVRQRLTLWYFHVSVTFASTKVLTLAGRNVKQLMQFPWYLQSVQSPCQALVLVLFHPSIRTL